MAEEKKQKYPFQMMVQKAVIKLDGEDITMYGVGNEWFRKESDALAKAEELFNEFKQA